MPPSAFQHRLALPPGTVVGSYAIQRVLGEGGFGITYLAEHTGLLRTIALKELLPTDFAIRDASGVVVARTSAMDGDMDWARRRFLEEARNLVKCRHPNVVEVSDVFEANGTAYMATGYEEGQTLEEWLRHLARPPREKEVREILLPLLAGLQKVHDSGLLHRDLKPANIYCCGDGRPLLLDFGAAREYIGSRSRPVTSILTPGYAPLEQYSDDEAAAMGPWSDLYSLGAVVYRMITGEKPPDAIRRHRNDPYQPLTGRYAADYNIQILRTVDAMLHPDVQKRPASAKDVLSLLDSRFPGSPPPATAPPREFPRPRRRTSAQPLLVRPEIQSRYTLLRSRAVIAAAIAGVVAIICYFGLRGGGEDPATTKPLAGAAELKVAPPQHTIPPNALKARPFVNSLGMEFVPAGTKGVLFAATETTRGQFNAWRPVATVDPALEGVSNASAYPVGMVDPTAAAEFCAWLTKVEQADKKIGSDCHYDLPTLSEWQRAAEVNPQGFYPWFRIWPPLKERGNFAETLRDESGTMQYNDGFPGRAMVKKFPANTHGLYDMAGNVAELLHPQTDAAGFSVIGGSFETADKEHIIMALEDPFRRPSQAVGFRCVLRFGAESIAASPMVTVVPDKQNPPPPPPIETEPLPRAPADPVITDGNNVPPPQPTGEKTFTNSLGMRLNAIGDSGVFMSIYETRVKDFAHYMAAVPEAAAAHPRMPADDDHPVTGISFAEAQAFCTWLTEKERKEQVIDVTETYALPTDDLWNIAADWKPDGKPPDSAAYPWGPAWPPPPGVANLADVSAKGRGTAVIADYSDGFPGVAPAGSFRPNHFGLFDLAGNVAEWATLPGGAGPPSLRGGGWTDGDPKRLQTAFVLGVPDGTARPDSGFRCVLRKEGGEKNPASALDAVVSSKEPNDKPPPAPEKFEPKDAAAGVNARIEKVVMAYTQALNKAARGEPGKDPFKDIGTDSITLQGELRERFQIPPNIKVWLKDLARPTIQLHPQNRSRVIANLSKEVAVEVMLEVWDAAQPEATRRVNAFIHELSIRLPDYKITGIQITKPSAPAAP